MDERFAYALNTLWTRHYELGRIVRFRRVPRGRQAEAFEILTAEQHEYTAYLYPPAFAPAQLAYMADALQRFDSERFSIVPMVQTGRGQWAVDGPQNTHLVVGLQATGQVLLPDEWTNHDISQLGLRLAWLHRLASEQLDPEDLPTPFVQFHRALSGDAGTPQAEALAQLPAEAVARLEEDLADAEPRCGFAHGDVQPAAFLVNDDRQIVTVVDWALLHQGEPLEDVVDAFVHWCVGSDGVVDADLGRVLLESYRSLRPYEPAPWREAVVLWCARRIMDAAAHRRPLPKKFGSYLNDPANLASALELCEAR